MSEPIRVLHVVTHMNRGGLESMIMNYYRNIDRSKVQFDFLTHRPAEEKKDFDEEIRSLGGKIYHIHKLNPFSYTYRKELDSFFKAHPEYCIIHVHQDCMSGIILKVAKKNGLPVRIAHCHSSSQDKGFKYLIKIYFKKNIKKYATKLFACGVESGIWMFETDDFEVFPNAIDSTNFKYNLDIREKVRNKLNIDNNCLLVGHVGRFCEVKNHKFIVEIAKILLNKQENTKFMFVGEGELMNDIMNCTKKIDIENKNDFLFLGLRTDISDLMQAMDVFVFPSLYEGLPLTVIEAQASGLPCIISDKVPHECKITDLVEFLSLELGPKEWAQAIMSIVGSHDRQDMSSSIRIAGFDVKENALKLEKYYLSGADCSTVFN